MLVHLFRQQLCCTVAPQQLGSSFGEARITLSELLPVMQQVCGISSPAAAALRSINTPSNICEFRDPNTVGSVFPTHLVWPVSGVCTTPWPWPTSRLWSTNGVGKGAGAGVRAAEVVSSVEPTPPLPSVSLLWLLCLFHPADLKLHLKKKESLSIPLTFTSTRLFLLNTHENTQLWLDCSLSYFSQIPNGALPFKAAPHFSILKSWHTPKISRMSSRWVGLGNKCQL